MLPHDRQRLEAAMPFYVNGRIDARDRAFIDAHLHEPEVASMLAWHRELAHNIRSQVDAVSDSVGLQGLMEKIHAQQREPAASPIKSPSPVKTGARPGWQRWISLDHWLPPAVQAPTFAALLLVVAAQGVLLYQHGGDDPLLGDGYSNVRGTTGAEGSKAASKTVIFKINFRDETTEQAMRLLLISAGAHIVRGPGQLGDYDVSVPIEQASAAEQILQKSTWVNAVVRQTKP